MADEENKVLRRFELSPENSVLINKYSCFYNGGKIPVYGTIYVLNDHVCFMSKLNSTTLIGKYTKIKLTMQEIILCEVVKSFGTGIRLTT